MTLYLFERHDNDYGPDILAKKSTTGRYRLRQRAGERGPGRLDRADTESSDTRRRDAMASRRPWSADCYSRKQVPEDIFVFYCMHTLGATIVFLFWGEEEGRGGYGHMNVYVLPMVSLSLSLSLSKYMGVYALRCAFSAHALHAVRRHYE